MNTLTKIGFAIAGALTGYLLVHAIVGFLRIGGFL